MHREDELDAFLTDQAQGRSPRSPVSRDMEPLLAAAARLDSLRDAAPSSAFAADLEARLMARMSQLPSTAPTQLRQAPRRHVSPLRVSSRAAWAAIAATLILTIGLGALTAQAAPGAPLYVVRKFAQTLAGKALPSATVDPFAELAQARADLAAYDTAIAAGNAPAALTDLGKLRADDALAAKTIPALGDATTRQQAQTQLSDFRQGAATDLRASLAALNWKGRAQVTDVLRAWGNTSLTVTQVTILADSSEGKGAQPAASSVSRLIEARGSGFAVGAQVLVNGVPSGELVSLTPTQLTVRVAASAIGSESSHNVVIGVENPDGAVALASHVERDDHSGSNPVETPGAGDHNGDHGGSSTPATDTTPTGGATPTGSPTPEESPSPTRTPSS